MNWRSQEKKKSPRSNSCVRPQFNTIQANSGNKPQFNTIQANSGNRAYQQLRSLKKFWWLAIRKEPNGG
jgi:hypothetical protein